jgi:hypothetical protein
MPPKTDVQLFKRFLKSLFRIHFVTQVRIHFSVKYVICTTIS